MSSRQQANDSIPQRGMALIAVLWIVAALSVMVTGLTKTVRQQITLVGTQRDQTSGMAMGEAAIALTLQDMLARSDRPVNISTGRLSFAGVDIEVDVAPLNGLISLNGADAALLTALLRVAGGLGDGQAQTLASTLVEWRDGRPEQNLTDGATALQPRRFEAPEDLLLVPGVDYPLYARIVGLVSADLVGVGRVSPQAAPPEVLGVLAQGDVGRVEHYLGQRAGNQLGADSSVFPPAFVGGSSTDLYRLTAKVPLEAGKMLLLTRDVALGSGYSRTSPWRVLRTDRQIVTLLG